VAGEHNTLREDDNAMSFNAPDGHSDQPPEEKPLVVTIKLDDQVAELFMSLIEKLDALGQSRAKETRKWTTYPIRDDVLTF